MDIGTNTKKPPEIGLLVAEASRIKIEPKDKDKDGNLLAPNGQISRLDEIYWRIVRTQSFQKWFDGSQVVGLNGEPLVVYHSSRGYFDKFENRLVGKNSDIGIFGNGFYFTPSKKQAEKYGVRVVKAFLSIKNIQRFELSSNNALFRDNESFPEEIEGKVQSKFEEIKGEGGKEDYLWAEAIRQALEEAGKDGAVGINRVSGAEEYMVLVPDQILMIRSQD